MKLDTKLKVLIKNAIANDACEDEIEILNSLGDVTLDDIKNHPKAPEWAFWYAETVIEGRWPEAENIIKTDPSFAFSYAKYVIEGRWPEAENIIKTDPHWAYWYAENVIEGRWPEAENIIKTDPVIAKFYEPFLIVNFII